MSDRPLTLARLREAIEIAQTGGTEDHPYDQAEWGSSKCGTPCCVIGHAYLLAGMEPQKPRPQETHVEDHPAARRVVDLAYRSDPKVLTLMAGVQEDGRIVARHADLRYAGLEFAWLRDADLTGADLRHANLRYVKLPGANLSGANLSCVNLPGANLIDANLSRANFTCAELPGANLIDANLSRANFTCADLTGADLTGADLTGADLTGARRRATDPTVPGWTVTDSRLTKDPDNG